MPASASSPLQYWLVGTQGTAAKGNNIKGGPSKVVLSATTPKGYDFTAALGPATATATEIAAAIAAALPNLPTGISAASSYSLPGGLGTAKVSGPGGVAGTLNQAAVGTGNAAQTALNAAEVLAAIWDWLTTASNWLRILEFAGGAVLVYMALHAMSGAGPGAHAVVEAAAAVPK